jgi:hypothetical protein
MACMPHSSGDPNGGGQRYSDGTDWTDHITFASEAALPNPPQKKRPGCLRSLPAVVGVFFLIGLGVSACGSDGDTSAAASSSSSESISSSSSSESSTATPTTPAGVRKPAASFTAEEDGSVTASFGIQENFAEGVVKDGARLTTIDILEYAHAAYPSAPEVQVRGTFPMKDSGGKITTYTVVDLTYLRSTLDHINFEGIDKDKIWEIADSGVVAPEFRP